MTGIDLSSISFQLARRWLLKNISLHLAPTQVVGLIGPNGSGKSTLLRVMAGLRQPSGGRVLLEGRDLRHLSRREAARTVAFVPQDTHIDFSFTVEEIVKMGRHPHRQRLARETAEDRAATEAAMQKAAVDHLRHRLVTTLSGGERQRVLIARSLATQSQILLLDEPTANLDIDHALEILELCQRLAAEGKAIMVASHDLNAVTRYASQVALLDCGCLAAFGPPTQVVTEATLRQVFRVDAERVGAANGTPVFVFHRHSPYPEGRSNQPLERPAAKNSCQQSCGS
ncbi:MAG: ABC transporter ATP-binding protein [Acidobacteriota bacterium]